MLATVSGTFREHGSPELREWRGVKKKAGGNEIRFLWAGRDFRPPEGQRHPIQQEGGHDFRANWESGVFDGQPGGRLFVGRRNGVISRNESTSVITLRCGDWR